MSTYRKNGHKAFVKSQRKAKNGSKVAIDPVNAKLPWKKLLPKTDSNPTAKESESSTVEAAKKENPVAETTNSMESQTTQTVGAEAAEERKKKVEGSSISNTLTSCDVFIATANNLAGYLVNRELYKLASLRVMRDNGYSLVKGVTDAEAAWRFAVARRKDVFGPLEARLTRILAEVVLGGALPATIEQVRAIIRKVRGERAVAKDPKMPAEDYNSVSQQNHDDIVANFARLLAMLQLETGYDPALDELKLVALTLLETELRAANDAVINTKAEWEASIDTRNNFFNAEVTGLVDVFLTAKKVVLANYGFKSEEYGRVKGLRFLRIRK